MFGRRRCHCRDRELFQTRRLSNLRSYLRSHRKKSKTLIGFLRSGDCRHTVFLAKSMTHLLVQVANTIVQIVVLRRTVLSFNTSLWSVVGSPRVIDHGVKQLVDPDCNDLSRCHCCAFMHDDDHLQTVTHLAAFVRTMRKSSYLQAGPTKNGSPGLLLVERGDCVSSFVSAPSNSRIQLSGSTITTQIDETCQ